MAAIAVMFRHMSVFGIHAVAQSYLGVDVFFALSGAVVASAYERRLLGGLSTTDFVWIRVRRLWPMIALGMALGLANALWGQREGAMAGRFWLFAVLAFIAGDLPFLPMSFNRPSWTMFFEFSVNLVYARIVRWLTSPVLLATCGASALILAWASYRNGGLDIGDDLRTFGYGAARTVFSFFLGVGLYRLHRTGRLSVPSVLTGRRGLAVCFGLLTVCLFLPAPHGLRWLVALLSVLLLVPAIVVLGLESHIGGRAVTVCAALGAVSYPLYLIHDPLGMLTASSLIHHGHAELLRPAAAAFAPAVVLLAWAVNQWVDVPARQLLATAFRARERVAVVAPVGP